MEQYIKVERIQKWLDERIEDYVDEVQEMLRQDKQEGPIYMNKIKEAAYEEFISNLQNLKTLIKLEAHLHGKEE